jgi:xylulokinase
MNCLGIDIGTQSLKVLILREGKVQLAQSARSYDFQTPQPGWAEQDPKLWLEALAQAVPEALSEAGLAPADIDGIGIAGQLDGCVAVDSQCPPQSNCLLWMDRRAQAQLPSFEALSRSQFREHTGQVMDASHMAAKISWLRENLDGLKGARFHQPTSFLVERLCGAFVFDHALASTTMLYKHASRSYDEDLLLAFGIDESSVPKVLGANEVAGALSDAGAKLTGLVPGIPVVVGTGDDFSTALGAGVVEPGPMLCVLGTAEVVAAVSRDAVIDTTGLVETHGYFDHYLLENPGWLSGGALLWLRRLLSIASDKELDALAAASGPGARGLTFIPALTGAMAPEWQAEARGCFYGLTNCHGPGDMARAVLEGCAFAMLDVRTRLRAMDVCDDEILIVGGGARSPLWAQIRADLCQARVWRDCDTESSAVGAALLAQSAIDGSVSLDQLATQFPRQRPCHDPDAALADAYQEAYRRYRLLFESLRPMW